MKFKRPKKTFRKEFKKQIRLAITAAIGFTIAFAWREAIFQSFENLVGRVLDLAPEHFTAQIYTAISITVAGVLLILLTSKILKENK